MKHQWLAYRIQIVDSLSDQIEHCWFSENRLVINIVTWSLKSDDFLFCCRNTICKRTWYWEDRAVMSVITYDREESVLRGQVPLLKFKVSFFNIQRRSKNSLHAESRNITDLKCFENLFEKILFLFLVASKHIKALKLWDVLESLL